MLEGNTSGRESEDRIQETGDLDDRLRGRYKKAEDLELVLF